MKRVLIAAIAIVTLSMLALPVHAQDKGGKAKTMTVQGTVKSVSNTAMTVSAGGKDMNFVIDGKTTFIGKGLSTKTRQKGKMTATDSVAANDKVSVSYTDMSGTLHATEVRITDKAPK